MKLWDKGYDIDGFTESFTIGKDRELDVMLAGADVIGNLAHLKMLHAVGLVNGEEYKSLQRALVDIYGMVERGEFVIEEGIEDVHSQIELLLVRECGDAGKKIHTGRSRNDQVLLDLKLFTREAIFETLEHIERLFDLLIRRAEENKDVLIPGYTHLQVAMPSSFGLWFGAYAESLADDLLALKAAYDMVNTNPLGSGAGYGSSIALNRQMTTDLLTPKCKEERWKRTCYSGWLPWRRLWDVWLLMFVFLLVIISGLYICRISTQQGPVSCRTRRIRIYSS